VRREQARVDPWLVGRRAMLVVSECKARRKVQRWMRCCSVAKRKRLKVRWRATCIRNETWKAKRPETGWIRGMAREREGVRWVLMHRWNGLCPTSLDLRLLQAPWVGQRQQQVVG
jgi:hypothetical protein